MSYSFNREREGDEPSTEINIDNLKAEFDPSTPIITIHIDEVGLGFLDGEKIIRLKSKEFKGSPLAKLVSVNEKDMTATLEIMDWRL